MPGGLYANMRRAYPSRKYVGAAAKRKQMQLAAPIGKKAVDAFSDTLCFVQAVRALGWPVAAMIEPDY
ncbi:hypothetical protein BSU04_43340 [Caballeronia sordidicola]|uniref:Uncharacterized protein n=1 Tax=Caballeronia sordidicola TaxID=196367 RepID=A0A226WLY5_CABSO|nr:hypothetical protein BSU04_43340 [Caballeronia sordidicola]